MNTDSIKHSVIVISEGNYLFGFDPSLFDGHFPLNEIWISPVLENNKIWNFEKKDASQKGLLINLNQFINQTSVSFHHNGTIFIKNITGETDSIFGFFCNSVIAQITVEENDKRLISMDSVNRLPTNLSPKTISEVIKYKRKNVLVIDPLLFFKFHLEY